MCILHLTKVTINQGILMNIKSLILFILISQYLFKGFITHISHANAQGNLQSLSSFHLAVPTTAL